MTSKKRKLEQTDETGEIDQSSRVETKTRQEFVLVRTDYAYGKSKTVVVSRGHDKEPLVTQMLTEAAEKFSLVYSEDENNTLTLVDLKDKPWKKVAAAIFTEGIYVDDKLLRKVDDHNETDVVLVRKTNNKVYLTESDGDDKVYLHVQWSILNL